MSATSISPDDTRSCSSSNVSMPVGRFGVMSTCWRGGATRVGRAGWWVLVSAGVEQGLPADAVEIPLRSSDPWGRWGIDGSPSRLGACRRRWRHRSCRSRRSRGRWRRRVQRACPSLRSRVPPSAVALKPQRLGRCHVVGEARFRLAAVFEAAQAVVDVPCVDVLPIGVVPDGAFESHDSAVHVGLHGEHRPFMVGREACRDELTKRGPCDQRGDGIPSSLVERPRVGVEPGVEGGRGLGDADIEPLGRGEEQPSSASAADYGLGCTTNS